MATLRTGRQCWQENFLCLSFKSTQNTKFTTHCWKYFTETKPQKNSHFFQPVLALAAHQQVYFLTVSINWPFFSLCGRNFGHLATSKGGAAHRTLLLQSHALRGHLAGADGRVHPPEPQPLSGGRPGQGGFRQTGTLHTHTSRVADPDPIWIRIQSGQWIRIRIRNPDPDPRGQKWPTQVEKNLEISNFEVLDVLFWELKASFVTWKSFIEA